ncbi:hypothetical protein Tco_1224478 [Tanacetum coccineum]
MAELRRSGRFRGQRPVVKENTIDEAINVHEEDSDDDFVPTSYPSKQATGSNTTPVKWTKRLIVARSPDVQTVVKGLGEKEDEFMEEDENGVPEDLEGFAWKLEKYIETIFKSKTCFDKTIAIGMEVYPDSALLKDLEAKYVEVMSLETGGKSNNNFNTENTSAGLGKATRIDKVKERKSDGLELIGFDSPQYTFGPFTQAAGVETAERVVETAERGAALKLKGKAIDIEEIPSFSFGVTQDFPDTNSVGVTNVSTNVIQPLNAMPVSFCPPSTGKNDAGKEKRKSEILFETKNGHQSNRAMLESLGQTMAVEDNVLDAWGEVLNFNERLRDALSPLRAFLPTFVMTNEFRNAKLSAEVRYNLFTDYMRKSIVKDKRWNDFKDVGLGW